MRYIYFSFFLFSLFSFSQNSIFLKSGRNLTKYSYTNELNIKANNISSDFGNSYSFGYSKQLKPKFTKFPLFYNCEIALDEFNSSVYNKNLLVNWRTLYAGVNNSMLITVLKPKNFKLDFKLGANISTIIYGKQVLDNQIYDIKNTDSFKGVFLTGVIGIQAKYSVSETGGLSIGYDRLNGFNPSLNASEKFSITSNRVWFGVYYNLKKDSQKTNDSQKIN